MHYLEVLYKSQNCEAEKKFKKHCFNIQIGRANFWRHCEKEHISPMILSL